MVCCSGRDFSFLVMVLDLYDLWSLGDGVMLCIGEVFRESNEIMFEPLNLLWLSSMRETCLEVT